MRHIGWHAHDRARRGRNRVPGDGQDERAFLHEHQCIERSRVFAQRLTSVERKQRDGPAARLAEHSTRNAVFC